MEYDMEIDRAVELVKESGARKVCIQLPDGLKPKAKEIVDTLESRTDARVHVWAGSCFGACDTPQPAGYDVLIQWGHSEWKK